MAMCMQTASLGEAGTSALASQVLRQGFPQGRAALATASGLLVRRSCEYGYRFRLLRIGLECSQVRSMPTVAPAVRNRHSRQAAELYLSDTYSWSMQQADALRRRDLNEVDWDNVIEEIESVGRAQRNRWVSLCARALEHLLAIEYWTGAGENALVDWAREVMHFRRQMADVLDANPGLQGQYAVMYASAWRSARRAAVDRLTEYQDPAMPTAVRRKWDRLRLPAECPYQFTYVVAYDPKHDDAPDNDIWPPSVAQVLNRRLARIYPILPERPDTLPKS